ncbi:alpha/beta fold hydrolase [Phytoactinopolyspora halotolerans]|uniref:Alpha/beta hydrolase n=1 Tax=Phytoactinopolyspora halotolerans TaxID=1981512 RepID=A0A6L9SEI5_9ACTN|nr:alpha/beta hydrolase [Phytoactinopolyspora halotolerans]NEE02998.1 alpha/beta hydrolase [Phytoactinopolyspora halotolerans]
MTSRLWPGVVSEHLPTARLDVHMLHLGRTTGEPVLLLHGNVSSALFWQRTMLDLPERYRPIAVDLRGFGDTESKEVNARRGLSDYADDVAAVVDALDLTSAHLVGWSMGGGVALQALRDRPGRVASVTLVNPVSPYGFGGTHGVDGQLNDPAGAGSGGGCANPDFVSRLASGDRSGDVPTAPRQVFLGAYVQAGFTIDDEAELDTYLDSMLSTRTGEGHYPGDVHTVDTWPGVAPGDRGVLNAMAPTHFRIDDLPDIDPKPPIGWIRGEGDVIVSDTSLFDLAHLGAIGAVDGWPGDDVAPAQPMIAQTRHVLDRYAAAGGSYTETVIAGAGHSPHIEQPKEFANALLATLTAGRISGS